MSTEFTAQGGGYFRVFVNGAQVSQHTAEREAAEECTRQLDADANASVYYDHDYTVVATREGVVPDPDPNPDPIPDPDPDPDPIPDPDPDPDPIPDPDPDPAPDPTGFRMLEMLLYNNAPDFGLEDLPVASTGLLRPADPRADARAWAAGVVTETGLICLDKENWGTDSRWEPDAGQRNINRQKMLDLIEAVQNERPDLDVGYYGELPSRHYWGPITEDTAQWEADNDANQVLFDTAEVFFPSMYAFYNNATHWEKYARGMIAETRRKAQGKAVYPFIWHLFHGSGNSPYQEVPKDFFRMMLDVCYEKADGVVLFGGWSDQQSARMNWNDPPWYQAFLEFKADNGL